MTPAARIAAAIDLLDQILAGSAAEKALTQWGRSNRYAGSKDRAAIRDHVFDALRSRRSLAALGGAETGRGIMIGAVRRSGGDLANLFTGIGHAPAVITDAEYQRLPNLTATLPVDLPDWLAIRFAEDLGDALPAVLAALQTRAPVFLRVNPGRGSLPEAVAMLAQDGISSIPVLQVKTALQITDNARKIHLSQAYLSGLVEVQDASSQRAVLQLPLRPGLRILDYCAGGGGKALAIAALTGEPVFAHDIDPARMVDLAPRAARAGAMITPLATAELSSETSFDLILVDAPCSGSGTWRRAPDAKWRLTPDRLDQLCALQSAILLDASRLVGPGGILAYATCSIINSENSRQVGAFLHANPGWISASELQLLPSSTGDGFYLAVLSRNE